MDRFGLGYVAALILLLLAGSLLWWPPSGPGEVSARPVDTPHPVAAGPPGIAAPAVGPTAAATAAVITSEGRSYRILVGRDATGHTWSAALGVGD
jgi:hypothetical protein